MSEKEATGIEGVYQLEAGALRRENAELKKRIDLLLCDDLKAWQGRVLADLERVMERNIEAHKAGIRAANMFEAQKRHREALEKEEKP